MIFKSLNSDKTIIFLMVLGIFCFSVWGAKAGLIPCLFGGILFFRTHPLSKTQIYEDFYPIRWWIFANLGIILMACVSLFFCFNVFQTSIAILNFLIIPLTTALIFFLTFKHTAYQDQKLGIALIFSIFILHSLFTIIHFILSGNPRSVGIGNHSIIPYTLFLLIPFALSLSLLIYARFKVLAVILMGISLFALHANGTRASILSVGAMIFGSILYPQYKYKKIIIVLTSLMFVLGIGFLIEWSGYQNTRFNFKQMIKRAGVVWSYAPAEMGRFDTLCFGNNIYQCRKESGEMLDTRFSFESNALQRISLNKSALFIIQNNPLLPHGYYSRYWSFNLPSTLLPTQYPYLTDSEHSHIHNGILSSFFELGIIGGCLYLLNFLLPMIWGIKRKNFYGLLLFLTVLGIFIMSFFDSMLSFGATNITFYVFITIILAILFWRKK